MFALSGDGTYKQTKSARAGLQMPVGRFHRWMIDARLGRFVHEYAAVYLCAGFENLLEEILLQCVPSDPSAILTAMGLEHAIANSGDLWGLLQPFVHLNAGRIASGALTMPRWTSEGSVNPNPNGIHSNSSGAINNTNVGSSSSSKQEPCLLTTCVGTLIELKDLVYRSQKRSNHITLSQAALRELFYFMRCSQLEHSEGMCYNFNIYAMKINFSKISHV
jgi:ankyrin repeat/BTB/POZ domain-containing protein 2